MLRGRRRIAGAAPEWSLSPDGLKALRGDGTAADAQHVGQGRAGEADDLEEEAAPALPGDAGPLAGELAAIDRALTRSTRVLAGDATRAELLRNPLIYDPDWEDGERLEAWRHVARNVGAGTAPPGGGPPVGRLGKRTAARAAGLARPSFGFGNAADAVENPVASFLCEFGAALRPP